jgi:gas vesicle protein
MAKSKVFIAGLLCGGAIAGAAALFTSPSSKELRRKMKEKGQEWKHSLNEIKKDGKMLKNQVIHAAAEGKEAIAELKSDMQKAFSSWQTSIEPNKEKIQQELEELTKTLELLEEAAPSKNYQTTADRQ